MDSERMPPIYPREVLLEEFIVPLGTTQHRVAVDTAPRLGRYFGTTAQFWVNLQSRYDLDVERDNLGAELDLISPLRSA
jgi:plasmid maintenance system antidote protein VapI